MSARKANHPIAHGRRRTLPVPPRETAQRGAALLIAAAFITTVVAFAVVVMGGFTRTEMRDTYYLNDSLEALMLAESGIERALKNYATGTACASLGGVTTYELVAGSGENFQINSITNPARDFDDVTALPRTQCRIQVTGKVTATGVVRILQAVIDNNLLGGDLDDNFNSYSQYTTASTVGGVPYNWVITASGGAVTTYGVTAYGGLDCSNALFHWKGPAQSLTTLIADDNLTITLPTTPVNLLLTYDYRTYSTYAAGTYAGTYRFTMHDSGGVPRGTVTQASSARTTSNAPPYPGCPASTGGWGARQLTTLAVGAGGSLTLTKFRATLTPRPGPGTTRGMWIDNIALRAASGVTAAGTSRVIDWRDCSTASCP